MLTKGADEKIKGVLKKKTYKVLPDSEAKQGKKIQFDIAREFKPLKHVPKSSLMYCFLK